MKMKVSEPAVAYNTPYLQSLKNRIIASLDTTTDERKLQECLALLHADEMPGIYSDEEFAEELRLSESGGNATGTTPPGCWNMPPKSISAPSSSTTNWP